MGSSLLAAKDPGEFKDYAIEWGTLLTAETETAISASAWTVSPPSGLTVSSTTLSGTKTTAWVTGGQAGLTYGLTNRITTSGLARIHERTIQVPIKEL